MAAIDGRDSGLSSLHYAAGGKGGVNLAVATISFAFSFNCGLKVH